MMTFLAEFFRGLWSLSPTSESSRNQELFLTMAPSKKQSMLSYFAQVTMQASHSCPCLWLMDPVVNWFCSSKLVHGGQTLKLIFKLHETLCPHTERLAFCTTIFYYAKIRPVLHTFRFIYDCVL